VKSEYKLFGILSGFLYLACAVYAWWTWYDSDPHRVEWIGTVALILSGLLCLMCGGYFWFVSRRIDLRPEDRKDAEIADGAGEMGFFSPGSYYPFGIALAATVAGLGLVFWMPWLIAVGMTGVLIATGGLLFEYYTGTRRSAEH
jgi:Cytochrome c oxidase subunit IV